MIEFKGYLTAGAKKHFFKRVVNFWRNIFLFGFCMVLPTVIMFAIRLQMWSILIGCLVMILIIIALPCLLPKLDKDKSLPKRILIQDDIVLCVSDEATESRYIAEVKEVRDYGEYYDLVFPLGKPSPNFVCQKNLLTQGSLEEFEALFEGKIVKK